MTSSLSFGAFGAFGNVAHIVVVYAPRCCYPLISLSTGFMLVGKDVYSG